MNFLHLVTDYGVGDPAFGEVIQKLTLLQPNLRIYPTSVPAFSTLATGFWIGQYALVNSWPGLTIFSNTAPRNLPGKRKQNHGEPFVYALLDNGVHVAAVNAGHCLSFIKPQIVQFHKLKVQEHGSQFRSRDFYPQAVVQLLKHSSSTAASSILGLALSPSSIPDIPPNQVAFIDGYGNLKTTIRHSSFRINTSLSFAPGQRLSLTINNTTRTVIYANGIFEVSTGQLALAPGSSGGGDPFMEITLRTNLTPGSSAAQAFNFPRIGSKISFQ